MKRKLIMLAIAMALCISIVPLSVCAVYDNYIYLDTLYKGNGELHNSVNNMRYPIDGVYCNDNINNRSYGYIINLDTLTNDNGTYTFEVIEGGVEITLDAGFTQQINEIYNYSSDNHQTYRGYGDISIDLRSDIRSIYFYAESYRMVSINGLLQYVPIISDYELTGGALKVRSFIFAEDGTTYFVTHYGNKSDLEIRFALVDEQTIIATSGTLFNLRLSPVDISASQIVNRVTDGYTLIYNTFYNYALQRSEIWDVNNPIVVTAVIIMACALIIALLTFIFNKLRR